MVRITTLGLGLLVSACSAATLPAAAQDPVRDTVRTLEVTGRATVDRAPDRAVVELAVETLAPTAQEATTGNAETMTAVLVRLQEVGVERSAVQTQAVSLHPRYDRGGTAQEPTIVGYQAVNRVSVPVTPVDRVGAVVDAAVDAGANRVTGIRFELSDPEAAYHTALELAIAGARREAEVAAAALGARLGPAIRVTTGGGSPAPVRQMAAARGPEAMSTPVQPGELQMEASVQITYRLLP